MSYRTDPGIPQQAESLEDVVASTTRSWSGKWTGEEIVSGADGIWHLMVNPSSRAGHFKSPCGAWTPLRDARTALYGYVDCDGCRRSRGPIQ